MAAAVKKISAKSPAKTKTKTEVAWEIGEKIAAYLKRFEESPKINPGKRFDNVTKTWVPDPMGARDYYGARARGQRHRVWIIYVAYQGGSYLSIEDAQRYLAWLEAGNVGPHWRAFQ